jgi:hypothetical protein
MTCRLLERVDCAKSALPSFHNRLDSFSERPKSKGSEPDIERELYKIEIFQHDSG